MLTRDQIAVLEKKVYELLADLGMVFEHEKIRSLLLNSGCTESPNKRIRIPRRLIQELVSYQKPTQAADAEDQSLFQYYGPGVAWTHFICYQRRQDEMRKKMWREFKMAVFGSGPNKFYDYPNRRALSITTDIYIQMLKLVRATPEFGYIAPWYRSDANPRLERLESLVLGCKYAPEEVAGIEPMYHEEIKYIREIGEVMAVPGADNVPYLSGSIAINRPLIADVRNLDQLSERRERGIRRYRVANMPTFGLSTPATMAGAIVQSAAELIGGMVAVRSVEPEPELTARVIFNTIDMRNAACTSAAPEPTMLNICVKELFDAAFGGHLWTEPFFAVSAKIPGLQAVYENYYGAYRYARLTGLPQLYPGLGNIGYMGTGSPTQALLDMQIRKSEAAVRASIEVNEETLAYKEISEQLSSGQDLFLDREHTARHFQEMWRSPLFLNDQPSEQWPGDEKCLLDRCDAMWRDQVHKYEPPNLDNEQLRALDGILRSARKELL